MFRADKGEFKLDDYHLVIHPELSLSAFRAGDIPILERWSEKKYSADYRFKGSIDRMVAMFWISFTSEKLLLLRFWEDVVLYDQEAIQQELFAATKIGHEAYLIELKKWSEITHQATLNQRNRHDAWLQKVIGAPPPYEYHNWGEIDSLIEPRQEKAEIIVRFKYHFGENADLKTHFENRREQEHRLSMNTPKQFVPSQLPPGFRRKF